MPDIAIDQGRIFLNQKAHEKLKPLIEKDGEFLTVTYEQGEAYIFIPLNIAESVGGLNKKLSRKNDWGDLENIAFHEEKIQNWSVFRSEFNAFMSVFCNEVIKEVIESNELTGLYITPDLGNIFAEDRGSAANLNS